MRLFLQHQCVVHIVDAILKVPQAPCHNQRIAVSNIQQRVKLVALLKINVSVFNFLLIHQGITQSVSKIIIPPKGIVCDKRNSFRTLFHPYRVIEYLDSFLKSFCLIHFFHLLHCILFELYNHFLKKSTSF